MGLNKKLKSIKKVCLNDRERSIIKERLVSYILEYPVRIEYRARHIFSVENFFSNISLLKLTLKPMPIFLLLALLAGATGTAVAAEGALPGDPLYGVKVRINEEVRSTFALSMENKAHWESVRAERRLEEMEKLSLRGDLREDVKEKLQERFEKHSERARERINRLQEDGKEKAAAKAALGLEASLAAHGRVLDKFLNLDISATSTKRGEIKERVKEAREKVLELREKIEERINKNENFPDVAAQEKMRVAEEKIKNAEENLTRAKEKYGDDQFSGADEKLKAAKEALVEGKKKIDEKAFGKAFVLFQRAHSLAQESQILLKAKLRWLEHQQKENDDEESEDDHNDDDDEKVTSTKIRPKVRLREKIRFDL